MLNNIYFITFQGGAKNFIRIYGFKAVPFSVLVLFCRLCSFRTSFFFSFRHKDIQVIFGNLPPPEFMHIRASFTPFLMTFLKPSVNILSTSCQMLSFRPPSSVACSYRPQRVQNESGHLAGQCKLPKREKRPRNHSHCGQGKPPKGGLGCNLHIFGDLQAKADILCTGTSFTKIPLLRPSNDDQLRGPSSS